MGLRAENRFTRYLVASSPKYSRWRVSISGDYPISIVQAGLNEATGPRYSPILPAYLLPDQAPPPVPTELRSIAFFFSRTPYNALGYVKPSLSKDELDRV